jgi:hypothetical protein
LQFIKTAKIIAISQIAIHKNGQICAILQIIKIPLYRDFCNSKKGQIIAILQFAIYKKGQIIAILQIIKIPLHRDFCNS